MTQIAHARPAELLPELAAIDADLAISRRPQSLRPINELAREHGEKALRTLVELCEGATAESTRLAAANAILDRAYGKPAQAVVGQFDGKLTISWAMPGDNAVTIDLPTTQQAEK